MRLVPRSGRTVDQKGWAASRARRTAPTRTGTSQHPVEPPSSTTCCRSLRDVDPNPSSHRLHRCWRRTSRRRVPGRVPGRDPLQRRTSRPSSPSHSRPTTSLHRSAEPKGSRRWHRIRRGTAPSCRPRRSARRAPDRDRPARSHRLRWRSSPAGRSSRCRRPRPRRRSQSGLRPTPATRAASRSRRVARARRDWHRTTPPSGVTVRYPLNKTAAQSQVWVHCSCPAASTRWR